MNALENCRMRKRSLNSHSVRPEDHVGSSHAARSYIREVRGRFNRAGEGRNVLGILARKFIRSALYNGTKEFHSLKLSSHIQRIAMHDSLLIFLINGRKILTPSFEGSIWVHFTLLTSGCEKLSEVGSGKPHAMHAEQMGIQE